MAEERREPGRPGNKSGQSLRGAGPATAAIRRIEYARAGSYIDPGRIRRRYGKKISVVRKIRLARFVPASPVPFHEMRSHDGIGQGGGKGVQAVHRAGNAASHRRVDRKLEGRGAERRIQTENVAICFANEYGRSVVRWRDG